MAAWQTDRALTCLGSVTETGGRRGRKKTAALFPFFFWITCLNGFFAVVAQCDYLHPCSCRNSFTTASGCLGACRASHLDGFCRGSTHVNQDMLATCPEKMRSMYVFMHLSYCDKSYCMVYCCRIRFKNKHFFNLSIFVNLNCVRSLNKISYTTKTTQVNTKYSF